MQVYPTATHPIVASHLVEEGKAYIPESLAQEFPYGNTSGKTLDLTLNRNGQRKFNPFPSLLYIIRTMLIRFLESLSTI